MNSIFDQHTREALIGRINSLTEKSTALWGKMNVYQMMKHCTLWEEMILGKTRYKQPLIGKLLGRFFLKNEIKDDRHMRKHNPTIPELIVRGDGDVHAEKRKWISLVKEHENYVDIGLIHPYFGKMTKEQIGIHAYKHTDHHLRQFKV